MQVDLEINASKANRARLNQNPTKSQREILGALQVIYFSPEDLDLVRGEPTHRRDFLDKLLITRAPRLAGVISDYDRVVKQRNTLLKTRAPENALAPWTDQLAVGERSASTSNRNFEGRQGKGGRTHLVSPLVAAATALRGTLSSPADL